MILIWLVLALVLAIAIARVYKSNKLFWVAFTSLSLGIATESLINRTSKEDTIVQVQPMHVVKGTSNCYSFLADVPPTAQSLEPNHASKVKVPEYNDGNNLPDPYIKDTVEPPNSKTKLK